MLASVIVLHNMPFTVYQVLASPYHRMLHAEGLKVVKRAKHWQTTGHPKNIKDDNSIHTGNMQTCVVDFDGAWCQIMSNQLLSLSQLWRPTRRIQRALLTPRRKFTHYRLDLCTGNSYEIYCMRSQRYFLRILRQQCRLGMDNYNLYSLEGVAWCMFWRRKDVTWCDPSRIELYLCLFRFFDLFCSAPVIHCS